MVVLLEPIAAFGVLFLFLGLVAMYFSYKHTFGALLQQLADLGDVGVSIPRIHVGIHPLRPLADAAESIDAAVRRAMEAGINGTQWAFHRLMHFTGRMFVGMANEILALTNTVVRAMDTLVTHTIPGAAHDIAGTLVKPVHTTVTRVRVVGGEAVATLRATVATLAGRVQALEHAAVLPAPIAIPRTLPKVAGLEDSIGRLWEKVRGQADRIAGAGALALVGVALARIGLGWVRCSRVRRVGKQVCGMDTGLLESMLADTLLIVGTVSLIEFATEMQHVTADAEGLIRRFWQAA